MPELRDYQARTVEDVMSTTDRVAIAMPTGGGKTATVASIAARYHSVWWGAHRQELVDQARAALQLWAPNTRRTCMTVQSVNSVSTTEYDLMVFDEMHHVPAAVWSNVPEMVRHKRFVGMTATPERADGKPLQGIVDRIVVGAHYSELLERKLLVPCRIFAPAGDDVEGVGAHPLTAWQEYGQGKLTLAFAPSIEWAVKWNQDFLDAGIRSACVFGTSKDRTEVLDSFRAGETRVVWNVGVLTEGFDVPNVGCVLLARKVRTTGLYLQIVGRGLRIAPAKSELRLIDLGQNYRVHGSPTDDREYTLGENKQRTISRPEMDRWRQCKQCGGLAKVWQNDCPLCGYHHDTKHFALRILDRELIEVYEAYMTPQPVRSRALEFLRAEQLRARHDITWLIRTYKQLFGRVPRISFATPGERQSYYRFLNRFMKADVAKHVYRRVFGVFPSEVTNRADRPSRLQMQRGFFR